ncbi:hypothetical protein ZIOFF_028185 [Zingiber officinale]|uniref:Chromophore lyase CRL, chloroplastic n=1 Tax=Zingiber officinale TaxID=94328 RepID=A0A8J5L9P8_ZINOF|nr:hypothetical protein ZIOFF_028185 [Zingiber officinale]
MSPILAPTSADFGTEPPTPLAFNFGIDAPVAGSRPCSGQQLPLLPNSVPSISVPLTTSCYRPSNRAVGFSLVSCRLFPLSSTKVETWFVAHGVVLKVSWRLNALFNVRLGTQRSGGGKMDLSDQPELGLIGPIRLIQRFYMVKPCPKEMKCDVELSSYAIRDVEEYKNFCDRPRGQRPQPEEVIGDIAEHLTTIHLSRCERGKRCLYEGSSPPGGFPNTWGGASYCSSDLTIHRNGEVHTWDRGYDEEGNQVWGPKTGSYEFKPARLSNNGDMFSPLNSRPIFSLDKMESSFVVNEQ